MENAVVQPFLIYPFIQIDNFFGKLDTRINEHQEDELASSAHRHVGDMVQTWLSGIPFAETCLNLRGWVT